MKYVQVAILAFLVVIAGLLVGIYQTQHSTATSAESHDEGLFEPAQAPPQTARQPDSAGIAGKSVQPVTNRAATSVEPKPDPRRDPVEPRGRPAEPPRPSKKRQKFKIRNPSQNRKPWRPSRLPRRSRPHPNQHPHLNRGNHVR